MFEIFRRQQSEPVVRYAEGSHLPKKEAKKILPDADEVFLDADPRPEELPVAITQHNEDGWMSQAAHDERIMKQEGYQQGFDDEDASGGPETFEEFERAETNERNYNSPESIEGQTLYDRQITQEFRNEDEVETIEAQFDQKADEYILRRSLERNQDLDGRFTRHARGGNSKPIEKDYKGGERIVGKLEVNEVIEKINEPLINPELKKAEAINVDLEKYQGGFDDSIEAIEADANLGVREARQDLDRLYAEAAKKRKEELID